MNSQTSNGIASAHRDHNRRKSSLERVDNWLTKSNPPWKAGLAVAIAVMVAGGVLVVLMPELLAESLPALANYTPAERTDWIDSVRTGLLGVIAFGTVAAWITQYRQSVLARTYAEYNEGVRQLAKGTWEQVAAIRDLEAVALSNPEFRGNVMDLLAVFVRDKAPRTEALSGASTDPPDNEAPKGKHRPEPGVQEALRVIGDHLDKWAPQPLRTKEDIADASEDASEGQRAQNGSSAHETQLPSYRNYVSMADIAIDGAVLRDAKLVGLNLRRSLMRDVKFERADLTGARMRGAILSDADFERATLAHASLVDAKLNQANLIDADVRHADMRRAHLEKAKLRGANMDGAHLWGAVGFSHQSKQIIGRPHCLPGDPKCTGSPRVTDMRG